MTGTRTAAPAVGLAVLLVLGGCGGNDIDTEAAGDDNAKSVAETRYPTQHRLACDILTKRIAKELLGSVGDESRQVPGTGGSGVKIGSCVRTSDLADLRRSGAVSLVMRVARNSDGAQANADAFAPSALPRSARKVDGYGEKAFWNSSLGQLNILNDGNWYVLASGPIDPKRHTLADAEKLADAIIDKL
jgi:hypothetical protein